MIDDLPEQLDLLRSGFNGERRIRDDLRDRTHAFLAARIRDHAEGAELVAPFDDRDVSLERIAPLGNPERKRDVVQRIQIQGGRREGADFSSTHGGVDQHRQPLQVLGPDNDVHRLGPLENLIPLLLRDASRDGDYWTAARFEPAVMDLAEPGEQLLFGAFPHAAGVDDDDVRILVVCR